MWSWITVTLASLSLISHLILGRKCHISVPLLPRHDNTSKGSCDFICGKHTTWPTVAAQYNETISGTLGTPHVRLPLGMWLRCSRSLHLPAQCLESFLHLCWFTDMLMEALGISALPGLF
jgi:hypothetical protein